MLKISACMLTEDLQEESLTSSSYMSSSSSSSSPNAHPLSIDTELWLLAEERIQEILCAIQPAVVSETKRKEVINNVWRLINGYYGIEVRITTPYFSRLFVVNVAIVSFLLFSYSLYLFLY